MISDSRGRPGFKSRRSRTLKTGNFEALEVTVHIGGRGVSHKFLFFDFIALTEAFKHVHVDGNHKNLCLVL